ncbi:DUF6171 family protein [Paenibacillus glycanilyticus]|uniref:Uncharacterized protein n=1 Tax=Paenibacillus glycanilyticus TaxID=126569 RepID=A0ABQ6G5I6_9BACL|nr:DUF6171 family protein [Paenibacillus glycanilyticus]GLX66226.1 hypothetical protein MU1_05700 [Paenibacillus glycanilyticus]
MTITESVSKRERDGCKGCSADVRVTDEQIQRLLSKLKPEVCVSDALYAKRLDACGSCASLSYGTTCMHCGCLVQVRAKLKDKGCPHPRSLWEVV